MHTPASHTLYGLLCLFSAAALFLSAQAQTTTSQNPIACPATYIPCRCSSGYTVSSPAPCSCTCVPASTIPPTPSSTTTTFKATPTSDPWSDYVCPATYIPCRCSGGFTATTPRPCHCSCVPTGTPTTTPTPSTTTFKPSTTSDPWSDYACPATYIPCRCSGGFTATTPRPCDCSCVPTGTPTTTTSPSITTFKPTTTYNISSIYACPATYMPCNNCPPGSSATTPAPCTCSCVPGPTQTLWGQCGGVGWTGPTACATGLTCHVYNEWYSEHLRSQLTGSIGSDADSQPSTHRSMSPVIETLSMTPIGDLYLAKSMYISNLRLVQTARNLIARVRCLSFITLFSEGNERSCWYAEQLRRGLCP